MTLGFYKLKEQPFGSIPDPRFLFVSSAHRQALASILLALQRGSGLVSLAAPAGLGKTTLLYHVFKTLQKNITTVYIFQAPQTPIDLLRAILADLGISEIDETPAEMLAVLEQLLTEQIEQQKRVVVIIDDAQNLNPSVLELVQMLAKAASARGKLLQFVLCGKSELVQTLAPRTGVELTYRPPMLAHLDPLSAEDTALYVDYRLRVAGYDSEAPLFSADACTLIARYSRGVPRKINDLCFNSLSLGSKTRRPSIEADVVRAVLADLGLDRTLQQPSGVAAPATRLAPPDLPGTVFAPRPVVAPGVVPVEAATPMPVVAAIAAEPIPLAAIPMPVVENIVAEPIPLAAVPLPMVENIVAEPIPLAATPMPVVETIVAKPVPPAATPMPVVENIVAEPVPMAAAPLPVVETIVSEPIPVAAVPLPLVETIVAEPIPLAATPLPVVETIVAEPIPMAATPMPVVESIVAEPIPLAATPLPVVETIVAEPIPMAATPMPVVESIVAEPIPLAATPLPVVETIVAEPVFPAAPRPREVAAAEIVATPVERAAPSAPAAAREPAAVAEWRQPATPRILRPATTKRATATILRLAPKLGLAAAVLLTATMTLVSLHRHVPTLLRSNLTRPLVPATAPVPPAAPVVPQHRPQVLQVLRPPAAPDLKGMDLRSAVHALSGRSLVAICKENFGQCDSKQLREMHKVNLRLSNTTHPAANHRAASAPTKVSRAEAQPAEKAAFADNN